MNRRSLPNFAKPVFVSCLFVAAALAACSSDDDSAGNAGHAGTGGGAGLGGSSSKGGNAGTANGGNGVVDGSAGEAGGSALDDVARGRYLVLHVAACVDCHTQRDAQGVPDQSKLLAGSDHFADLDPTDDTKGLVPAPNLTPDPETGLGSWTDAEIKNAFQNGLDKDKKPLFSIMPYYVFHNMSDADANAIVAYLRSVPAIKNQIPERQELGFPVMQAQPVPPTAIPETTLAASDAKHASAENGRYLAGFVGACLDCHSEPDPMGAVPLKLDKLLQGKDTFTRAQLGLPPVFPDTIVSANLTPAANGLKGWTAEDVVQTLHQGIDNQGQPLCPPMPFGPNGAFGGLTAQDALDIGVYLTSLAPQDNGVIPLCVAPGAPPGGGAGGASGSGGAGGAP